MVEPGPAPDAIFSIRRAHPGDAAAVQQISAAAYIGAYQAVIGAVPRPAHEDYRERIDRREVWVLETDRPLGVLVLEEKSGHLLIYSVAVDPDMAGRGYGTALLAIAERHALAVGQSEIRLYTNSRMSANLRLYGRCGFDEIGRRPHSSRPGEVLVDMAKVPVPISRDSS